MAAGDGLHGQLTFRPDRCARCHQRVGCAQVNTGRQATLMGAALKPGSLICNKAMFSFQN